MFGLVLFWLSVVVCGLCAVGLFWVWLWFCGLLAVVIVGFEFGGRLVARGSVIVVGCVVRDVVV